MTATRRPGWVAAKTNYALAEYEADLRYIRQFWHETAHDPDRGLAVATLFAAATHLAADELERLQEFAAAEPAPCRNCHRQLVDHDGQRCISAPYPGATGDHYEPEDA